MNSTEIPEIKEFYFFLMSPRYKLVDYFFNIPGNIHGNIPITKPSGGGNTYSR